MNKTLPEWLKECGMHDIQNVRVTIGAESWEGCRYKQTSTYGQCDAVTRGEKKATDTYTKNFIYLMGVIPKVYGKPPLSGKSFIRQRQNVCFPFEGLDWYVTGYMQSKAILQTFEIPYHPFGLNFMLAPWDIPGSKIDDYESKPYTRHEMKVEIL